MVALLRKPHIKNTYNALNIIIYFGPIATKVLQGARMVSIIK